MGSFQSRHTLFVITAIGFGATVSALTLLTIKKENPLAIGLVMMVVIMATSGGFFIAWMFSRFTDMLLAGTSLHAPGPHPAGAQQDQEAVIIDLKDINLRDSFHMARKIVLGTLVRAFGFLLLAAVLAGNLFAFAIEWSRLPAGPTGMLIVGCVVASALLTIFLLVVAAVRVSHGRGNGLKLRLTPKGAELACNGRQMSASWLELQTMEETRWGIFLRRGHVFWAAIPKRLLSDYDLSRVRQFATRTRE